MNKILSLAILFATLLSSYNAEACTAALVAAKRSSEKAPMLWKHRDSPDWDCHYEYIEGGKYAYTALVSKDKSHTYCGINEVGFAILNTVSENLKATSPQPEQQAITLMDDMLATCATVEEFEEMLRRSNGHRPYVTNYAVGDPSGALAFFEVWGKGYKRYDVSARTEGFDVRSNFSFAGDMVTPGPSVPRYDIIMRQMSGKHSYSPHDFIDYSRNFEDGAGQDVIAAPGTFVCNDLTVPRYFSVADMVAVCDRQNPRMLVIVGHPTAGMAVPIYVKAKGALPKCAGGRTALDLSEQVRAKVYSKVDELKYEVNKPLVAELLKVKTRCAMPRTQPKNIDRFNERIDARFAEHAAKIRRVLDRF